MRPLLLALLALLTAAAAQAQTRTERVRFSRGATSATVRDAVVRGERVQYVLGARAGQRVEIAITSTEGNAVFRVHGLAGETGDLSDLVFVPVTEWEGRLAEGGDVVVEVSPTRGNATYRVTFRIR